MDDEQQRQRAILCRETMAPSLCGGTVSSRRGLLASLWSLVTILTLIAFVFALIFSHSRYSSDDDDYYYQNNAADEEEDQQGRDAEIAVTSRAMAFAALWTAVLAALLSIFGTVVLGWQSPTGVYYTCCAPQVHRTTPLALGSFIGSLLMFANLTLVCSVLFGEFEVSFLNLCSYEIYACTADVWFSHLICCDVFFCCYLSTRFGIIGMRKNGVEMLVIRKTT